MKRSFVNMAILPLVGITFLLVVFALQIPAPVSASPAFQKMTSTATNLPEVTSTRAPGGGGNQGPGPCGNGCPTYPAPTSDANFTQPTVKALYRMNVRNYPGTDAPISAVMPKGGTAVYAGVNPIPDPLPLWVEVILEDGTQGYVQTYNPDYPRQKYVTFLPSN